MSFLGGYGDFWGSQLNWTLFGVNFKVNVQNGNILGVC